METYPEKKETMETKFDIFSSTPKPWEINPTAARKLHSLCSCCFRFCTCRRSGTIHDCAVRDSANQNGPKWGGIESRIVAMKECKKRSYIYNKYGIIWNSICYYISFMAFICHGYYNGPYMGSNGIISSPSFGGPGDHFSLSHQGKVCLEECSDVWIMYSVRSIFIYIYILYI